MEYEWDETQQRAFRIVLACGPRGQGAEDDLRQTDLVATALHVGMDVAHVESRLSGGQEQLLTEEVRRKLH